MTHVSLLERGTHPQYSPKFLQVGQSKERKSHRCYFILLVIFQVLPGMFLVQFGLIRFKSSTGVFVFSALKLKNSKEINSSHEHRNVLENIAKNHFQNLTKLSN